MACTSPSARQPERCFLNEPSGWQPTPRPPKGRPPRRLRILIVDDSIDSADALAELLQVEHEVRLARDGAEGLDLATRWRPELVFMDLGLPGIDGCEVARQMRARGLPGRLIALTGYSFERDRDRATAAGFDLHLVKPLAVEHIVELVDDAAHPLDRAM